MTQEDKNEALEVRNLAANADAKTAEDMIPEIQQKITEAEEAVPKRSRAGKIVLLIIAVFIIFAVLRIIQIQMADTQETKTGQTLTNVIVQTVERGSVSVQSPVSGRLVSTNAVNVIPLVSGEVREVFVKEGEYVLKGQVLFTIDSQQAQIQSEQARLNIKSAQDGVDSLKKSLDRMQALYDAGSVSLSDLESVQSQYTSALNSLEQAKLSGQAANSSLDYYTVTAPSSGCATTVNIVAGGVATQTSPAVVISDTDSLELEAHVSEFLINSVTEGQKVDVYIRSVSEEPFSGTVTNVADAPAEGTYTYEMKIALDRYTDLKAGMFAEISVVTQQKSGVVTVPSNSVVRKKGETYVALLNGKNTIELRPVTVGLDSGTNVEIKSGLTPGASLVVKGQNYVSDGERVNVVE